MGDIKTSLICQEKIPEQLKELDQWVVWRNRTRNGKSSKVPYDPFSKRNASVNNSETWSNFTTAFEVSENAFDGVGFVLSQNDSFTGFDLDDCRDRETGIIEDYAKEIIEQLESYSEVSPSGTGIRIFVKAEIPKNLKKEIEIYNCKRYLTVTGDHLSQTPTTIEERQEATTIIYSRYSNGDFGKPFSNLQLLEDAFQWKDGGKIRRLYAGDWSSFESQSEGDLSFCCYLARIYDGDSEKIDSMFRESRLMRGKWNEKHSADGSTYGELTIKKAVESFESSEKEKQKPEQELEFLSFAEILKRPKDTSPAVIEGVLYPKQSLLITGPTAIGKSTILLDLALALGAGRPFLNRYEISKPHRILMLQSENDFRTFQERLANMIHDWTGKRGQALNNIFTPWKNNSPQITGNICNRNGEPAIEFIKKVENLIEKTKTEVIMFDPLASFHGVEENDNSAMRNVLDQITRFSVKYSLISIIVHHHGKSRQDGAYNARGASAIADWPSSVLTLTAKKGKEEGHFIKAEWTKTRSFIKPSPLLLKLEQGSSFQIMERNKIIAGPKEVAEIIQEAGGELIGKTSFIQKIKDTYKIGRISAEKAVSYAIEKQYIIRGSNPEKKSEKIYTLPENRSVYELINND